jgi:predicted peptidase
MFEHADCIDGGFQENNNTTHKKKERISMNCRRIVIGLFALLLAGRLNALDVEAIMKSEVYKDASGELLNYRLYLPDGIEGIKNCPLLIFLHGAGERGSDNKKQLVHCIKDIVSYSVEKKEPMILVVPQCPDNMKWVNVDWGALSNAMPEKPSIPMKLTMEAVESLAKKYPVDQKRIYVTGLSMGGYGTWDAVQRWPEYFAAAMPLCGGGDDKLADRIKNVPIWAFHGDKDTAVKTERSRAMIEAIKKSGGNPKYTEYQGVGHDCWTVTFKNPEVLAWLFAQKRK